MRERLGSADNGSKRVSIAYLHQCKSKRQMDRARNGARYFRNPPQPHMCVQDFIEGSDRPCYINVMSWVKIVMPHNSEDSIPLYGGMRILPSSSSQRTQKKQPLIFAVMANPEILKISGKSAKNLSDRDGLIEVMLDFVEAMNPDIRFKRQFSVLKDRDLTGELKDIWLAVHMMRERERLEGVKGRDVVGPEGEWLQVAYETEVTLTEDASGAAEEVATHSSDGDREKNSAASKQAANNEWLYVSHETEVSSSGHMENELLMYGRKSGQGDLSKDIANSPPSKAEQVGNCDSGMSGRLTDCFSGADNAQQVLKESSISSVSKSSKTQDCPPTLNNHTEIVIVPQSAPNCLSNKKSDFEAAACNAQNYKCNESAASVIQLDHDYNLVKPFKADGCDEKGSYRKNEPNHDRLVQEKKKSSVEKVTVSEHCKSEKQENCAESSKGSAVDCLQSDTREKTHSDSSTDCSSLIKTGVSKHETHTNTGKKKQSKEKLCAGTVTVSVP